MSERKQVVRQEWIESERGWGQKPYGYSMHLTKEDLKRFVKEYWDSMPDVIPDCYEAPSPWEGPKPSRVSMSTYQRLVEAREQSKYGLREY